MGRVNCTKYAMEPDRWGSNNRTEILISIGIFQIFAYVQFFFVFDCKDQGSYFGYSNGKFRVPVGNYKTMFESIHLTFWHRA